MSDAPNPTEEQTSPRTFEEWFRDYWEAEAAGGYTDESVARATWDARQPEIDGLKAELQQLRDDMEGVGPPPSATQLRDVVRENSALRQRIAELEGAARTFLREYDEGTASEPLRYGGDGSFDSVFSAADNLRALLAELEALDG